MKLSIYLSILLLMVIPVSASTLVTTPATGITTDTSVLHATYNGILPTTLWFEYGGVSDGFYPYKTEDVTITVNGSYSVTLEGFPLMAGQTFYYRGVSIPVVGNQSSFTLNTVSSITGYNFDTHYDELQDAKLNVSKVVTVVPKPYEDILGIFFWGTMFGSIFLVMWIRSEDVTMPSIIGILISSAILGFVSPEYKNLASALLIVSIFGIMYSIIFKK